MAIGVNLWYRIRIDILTIILLIIICLVCILAQDSGISPVLLSMLLTYSMSIQSSLNTMLAAQMYVETQMVNAERCMLMTDVKQEKYIETGTIVS